jgi:hemolysin activation/secretion protein
MWKVFFRWVLLYLMVVLPAVANPLNNDLHAQEDAVTFKIEGFQIDGNTLFDDKTLQALLKDYTGQGKTSDDVESARDALEKHYHAKGYPTVVANIPEQSVEEGIVVLEIIESRIRRVRVTGNRFFTREMILKDLPSIAPGRILYVTDVQNELAALNRNPDLKVAPVLAPAKELGKIDVELNVKDRLPVHFSLELNNRGTHSTSDTRLNAMVSYDNLWQKEHSVSFQFQTSPQDTSEVKAITSSYVMSAPWNEEQIFVMYGLWSDSETAFGEGFEIVGSGFVFGIRNIVPLQSSGNFSHSASFGLDYKDFKEDIGLQGDNDVTSTPISYAPITAAYNAAISDAFGYTSLNLGVNLLVRSLAGDPENFADKRYKSRGNYLYATLGLERNLRLPLGLTFLASVDGQVANQPLISNEQFIAGGMESVRGFKESEIAGDHAVHAVVELGRSFQILPESKWGGANITPYFFYDGAWLKVIEALEGQNENPSAQGAGVGMRGTLFDKLEFQVDMAEALSDTDDVMKGDREFHFKIKGSF